MDVPLQFFPPAGGVAIKRAAFGDDSRGYVHRCFEVANDGRTVVGNALVAKEDWFVPHQQPPVTRAEETKLDYARMHCIEQTEADSMARIFNDHLDKMDFLSSHGSRSSNPACTSSTARPDRPRCPSWWRPNWIRKN